ncbi:MAG TPA: hypothetical protein VL027_01990 [Spongiibacteraceae bacterium]|nr:hypothetical protein [Spongiibacteraceae bacterium]
MKPLSFQRDHEPIPAMAGPRAPLGNRNPYKPDLAMQEAIRRSERQPRLLSMNSRAEFNNERRKG